MKCLLCDGRGYLPLSNTAVIICDRCYGTGETEEITNDEWRRTCSTEEFADWILDVSDECFDCGKSNNGDCPFGKVGVCTCVNQDSVVEWLKQPHTIKE